MRFKTINILWCAALVASAVSCTDEDYKVYDTTQKDSVFFEYRDVTNSLVDTVSYVYNYNPADVYTVKIPVTLMGMPKDFDRTIQIDVVADSTNMKEGVNYTITDNVISAGKIGGTVKINLLRDKDPEIRTMQKRLYLTVGENDELKSVGDNHMSIRYSDIRPETRPAWWLTSSSHAAPVYSFENAQLFFEYFYDLAPKANIDLFNEMINLYGDYFVFAKAVAGPFAIYDTFLRNYVWIPLYRDHPEIGWQAVPEW